MNPQPRHPTVASPDEPQGAEHVTGHGAGPVAPQASRRPSQRSWVAVQERDGGLWTRKPTTVEELPGAHAHLQVVQGDVGVVVREQRLHWALPREPSGESQDHPATPTRTCSDGRVCGPNPRDSVVPSLIRVLWRCVRANVLKRLAQEAYCPASSATTGASASAKSAPKTK
jgi:hypothetical protein